MTRAVSTQTGREAPGHRRIAPWIRACGFAAAAGTGVLAMYLVHPLVAGFELPIGPDGPVYVWWTRYADGAGLDAVPGARPGLPALALELGTLLGTGTVTAIALLGPVLAAAAGLSAAALLETALGASVIRAAAATLFTGAFAAYLAGGWLGNTALVALFLAGAAALALARRSWRAVATGTALLAAGALTHRIVSLFVLAVLTGVVLAHLSEAVRDRHGGARARDTLAGRAVVSIAAAAGLAWLGLLPALGAPRLPGDTSQDGFFRRHGLRPLLLDRYRERLAGDAARAVVPLGAGLGLGTVALLRRAPSAPGERFLASLVVSWAAVTVVGLVLFAATGWGPPNRVLVFAFFVPLVAAVGLASAWARGRVALTVAAGVMGVALVVVSMFGWVRQSPAFTAAELALAREAGRAVAALPEGTPLVFAVDTDEPAAAYHVTRALNVLRMGLPADRIGDAHVAVGDADDVLRGRPTLNGDPEHDAIARAYARELPRPIDRVAVVVVPALGASPPLRTDPLGPSAPRYVEVAAEPEPAHGVFPPALVGLSIAALALLGALGGGWAVWVAREAGTRAAVALAPSAGIAVIVLAAVFGERVGLDAGGLSGAAATLVFAGIGYRLALGRRRGAHVV